MESGAKAKTVKKYLGKGWMVDACGGHIDRLPAKKGEKGKNDPMWKSAPNKLPDAPWTSDKSKRDKIKKIIKNAITKDVREVFIATDPDREGEFIAWRLSEVFAKAGFKIQKRVIFNEITEDSVINSLGQNGEINYKMVDAAKVRMFMDRLIGWECANVSRRSGINSMGRVQTPTLGFIVEKELERESHIPQKYHSVNFYSGGINFKIRFHEKGEEGAWIDESGKKPKHYPERTFDKILAQESISILNNNKKIKLLSIKNNKISRKAKPPFTTDTMLQSSNSYLGWSLAKTSNIASELYEKGHITYIRTDSTRTNKDARDEVKEYIMKEFGDKYIGSGIVGSDVKKQSGNIQDAHEAIRPTRPSKREINENSEDLKKLYRLIWSRFAGSQMSDSIRENRSIRARTENFHKDIAGNYSWRIHSGWEEVFNEFIKNVVENPPGSDLNVGAIWKIDINSNNPELVSEETKPPRRFSESSIVQQMKKAGIGRPSTYVSMVQKLQIKKYVENINGALIPTENGRRLWLEVVPLYNDQSDEIILFSTQFTSMMELKLDNIANNGDDSAIVWHNFVKDFYEIHDKADIESRNTPSRKQINLLNDLLSSMSQSEREEILKGRNVNSLTREDIKPMIDDAINLSGPRKASKKQIDMIINKCDQLGLDLEEFLIENDTDDLDNLTGGRDGSASILIGKLFDIRGNNPATENQIKAIRNISKYLEIKIEDAMAIVKTTTIEEINFKDASELIGKLKKMKKK
jgi:DNA topoisomerase-1